MTSGSRLLTILVLGMLISVTWSPTVLAELEWEDDGWLTTSLATDKLESGDEFGCYQMLHLSWNLDPGAMAIECREYIESKISASKWGSNAISTYSPSSLTMAQHEIIARQGFVVHGDTNELSYSAWHNATDEPKDDWDWYNLGRRGGSLEQLIGSKEQVQSAVEEGGLVNLYWVGRVNDATIRHDRDIAAYLNNEAQAWMTTWGEAWSYWTVHDCHETSHSSRFVDNQTIIEFESLVTEQCTAVSPLAWNVPMTWILDVQGQEVVDIRDSNASLSLLDGVRKTAEGYTHIQNESLHLSLTRGHNVTIVVNGTVDYDILGRSQFWNNYSAAVTIAAHDTTDLFNGQRDF